MMVELMLGLTLITLVFMALLQIFPSAERAVVVADRTTQANHLARKLMEQTMGQPYDSLSLGLKQGSMELSHTKRRGAQPTITFLYSVDITQPDATRDVKEIYVRVEWLKEGSANGDGPHVLIHSSRGNLW